MKINATYLLYFFKNIDDFFKWVYNHRYKIILRGNTIYVYTIFFHIGFHD